MEEVDRLGWGVKDVGDPILAKPDHARAGDAEVVAIALADATDAADVQVEGLEAVVDGRDLGRAEVGSGVGEVGQRDPQGAVVDFQNEHTEQVEN